MSGTIVHSIFHFSFFLLVGHREYYKQRGNEQHAYDGVVSILPAVLVCKPCGEQVARLRDDEDVEIQHRHEEGALPFQSILYVGRRFCLHCEHRQRVHSRQVRGYCERAVEHYDDAHEARKQTGGQQYGHRRCDGAHVVERYQQQEACEVGLFRPACLQETHHERRKQAHPDACEEAGKLYVLRPDCKSA